MALSDSFQISQDPTFQGRVQAALLTACVNIANEGWAIAFHRERATFASQILSTTQSPNPYYLLFANSVATDPTCVSAANQNNTVPVTSTNRATQCALITDAEINNAISAQFNGFVREPAN